MGIGVLELLGQGLTLTLRQRLDESEGLEKVCVSERLTIGGDRVSYVLAADGLDNVVRWGSEQLGDD